jgi:hypothetical protein
MKTISIDHQDYKFESLSEDARGQLASLQFVDAEIARLQAQMAAFQTARNAYALALRQSLPPASDQIQVA